MWIDPLNPFHLSWPKGGSSAASGSVFSVSPQLVQNREPSWSTGVRCVVSQSGLSLLGWWDRLLRRRICDGKPSVPLGNLSQV